MIEAIKNIGEYAVKGSLERDKFLDGICQKVPSKKSNKKDKNNPFKQYVVILDFDTSQKKIKIDLEPISSETERKYLFVGSEIRHKLYCSISTKYIERLLTNTFLELKEVVNGKLKESLVPLLNNFFVTYSAKENKTREETFYLIQPDRFDFFHKKIEELNRQIKEVLSKVNDISSKTELAKEININKLWKDMTGEDYKIDNKKDLKALKEQIFNDCNEVIKIPTNFLLRKYMPKIVRAKKKEDLKKELKEKVRNLKDDLISSLGDNFSDQNIAFWTVKIDGELLCQKDEYKQMIYDEKITNIFKAEGSYKDNYNPSGTCSICGNHPSLTTSNVTSLDFKFYITDKKGFSSNLDDKFTKNYNICKECYQYLMIAENFIAEKLNTRIGDMNTYLIPQFILKVKDFDIDDFSKCLKDTNEVLANIDSIKNLQKEWKKFIEYSQDNKNSFVINYVFYHKDNAAFKILKLIKDVPPSRLDLIKRIEEDIDNFIDNHFEGNKRLKIDLGRIYRCIPIKVVNNEQLGTAKYLDIIDSIFSDRKIDYVFLINQFAEVLRIIKFESDGYNIWNKNNKNNPDFTIKALQLNLLLLFFIKLNILGGINMKNNTSNIEYQELLPDEIKNYWANLEIYKDERKRALFLLGYLIGEIGHRQSVKDIKNKPILNKINFQGMGTEKLIRVIGEVPDKLRQYDIFQYNEKIYAVCHMLMENHINQWKLSNQENVFYTLSGYAFSNYIGWQREKKKIEDNIKRVENDIKKAGETGKDISEQTKQIQEAIRLFYEDKDYKKTKEILKQIKINEKEDKQDG